MADRVGQQFGNYRLIRKLGQGGFAEVYLGEHIYLSTTAAIKVLHAEIDQDSTEHFHTEARTIARLVHPHIVRVLEFGIEGTTPFLVVDYAPNGTLRKRHPRGVPLPLPTVSYYVAQIASALQYAHEQKVIHRDVKPENMLIGRHSEVLLSDFGIALVVHSTKYESTKDVQELAGTVAYMAPEQIQAQAQESSDQYALAVATYEWLCGERPFQGSFAEIAVKHTLAAPPPLRQKVPSLSPKVEAIVLKGLAKDPKQRYPSVREFAAALVQACQSELPTLTTPPHSSPDAEHSGPVSVETIVLTNQLASAAALVSSPNLLPLLLTTTALPGSIDDLPGEQPEKELADPSRTVPLTSEQHSGTGIRSRRSVVLGIAGLATAGAIAGGVALLTHFQARQGIIPPTTISNALYIYHGHTGWVWSSAWSPDAKRIATSSSDTTVKVWDAASGDHTYTYTGHSDSVYALAWSHDGLSMASAGYDKTVQVWNAIYGDRHYTYQGHKSWVWSVSWSPDGKRIASAGADKTVQVWNASDGGNVLRYLGHSDFIYAVAWSPDGKFIASSSVDKTVQVWNASSGNLLYTYRPYASWAWAVAWSPDGQRIASAGDDKTVQVWDALSGNHVYIYYGHSDFVYAVAWSPDGQRIASAGEDKSVQVWDASDGGNAFPYHGHTGPVRTVAWASDSKRLVSAGYDNTAQVWQDQPR